MKTKLGILGGGQLARMMLPTCLNWDLDVGVLDKAGCVAEKFCTNFYEGSFLDKEAVWKSFQDYDTVTVDLENVSLEGLKALEVHGVHVAPSSDVLYLIKNKKRQKEFFKKEGLPTSDFSFLEEVSSKTPQGFLKLPEGGYDGKGVFSFKGDLSEVPEPFLKNVLWEEPVAVKKEISVLVARNRAGETQVYDPVEMVFDPRLNLIAYTLFPSRTSVDLNTKAKTMALELMEKIGGEGVMAVEMFVTKDDELLINELAPRPHNSGHHTIESCVTSQFENHLRGVLGLPLGSPQKLFHSLTFNIIGSGDGPSEWFGQEELLAHENAALHIYGKSECREGRKMGHVTLLARDHESNIKVYENVHHKVGVRGKKDNL